MKTYKYPVILILLILASCQDEMEFNNIENNEPPVIVEKTVENGRFIFSSKESLKVTIEDFQNDNVEKTEKEFERLYEKGFRSHKPIVNPENEHLQAKFSEEILQKRQLSKSLVNDKTTAEEDEFIADPLLASLVNDDNEIVVNDTLYKFTKEEGLFFTHVKDSTYLFNFFKEKNDQAKNTSRKSKTLAYKIEPCEMRAQYGGVTKVDDKISRYIRPIEGECYGGGGGSVGGGNPPSAPQTTEEERLQQIINSLPICEGRDNWFQNIFGKSYYCINYFDGKHRIKTEFWDQSWLIYKSVGILAKTQRKRFWVWWASKSDEIYLGINRILLKYNYKQPDISSITHPRLFNNAYKAPLYLYNGSFKVRQNNGDYYVDTQLNVTRNKLPFFDFGNEQILNIYIPNLPIAGDYNLNLTTQDITSQSNVKALYKMGIDFLNDKFNSGAKKEFAVTYQKNKNEIEVLYFGEKRKGTNDNKIKKKFYSDVSFIIGAAWGESSGWSFSVKPAESAYRNYTHYELDFYGMARRGSTWKGNRMIR
ncbi:hypothetical protein OOZ15_18300 [Galbibacter sp. EGI 63066]|uniref:hypothetical protein n=1 Tax=Galbibacter sp. EGI 63066 TaxID=2993559 RepID=UPI002249987C|nr:hypothetical protein [Galbibacter sp. EGI 63066]MCX2681910.1 hypothetical protein [Galbibacter sp. EGI 63066]